MEVSDVSKTDPTTAITTDRIRDFTNILIFTNIILILIINYIIYYNNSTSSSDHSLNLIFPTRNIDILACVK